MDDSELPTLLQLFVNSLSDCAIMLLDVEGNVVSWNKGACSILGYTADEAIGRHFSQFYVAADVAAAAPAAALTDALAQGRKEEASRRVRKDGTEFATQSTLMPLRDPQSTLLGFGLLLRKAARTPHLAGSPAVREPAREAVREQILVVDDNDDVRGVAKKQLTSLGYRVIAVASGAEALETLASDAEIDMLFTDVVMPGGMNGREVADQARRLRPGIKVLFASGYFEVALVQKGEIEESVHFIVKPYRKKELAGKVLAALAGTQP